MAKPKVENGQPKISTWAEAEAAMAEYAAAQNEIDKAKALLDETVLAAGKAFAESSRAAQQKLDELSDILKKFAQGHKGDFKAIADGGRGRTRTVGKVTLGFEWGQPYIHIPKKFEEQAIAWLEKTAPDTYVKRTPKIMRSVIEAELQKAEETHDQALIDKFATHHITREQDEEFVLKVEE